MMIGNVAGISAQPLFSRVDTDASGGVNLNEFVAARPEGVSKAQAEARFNELDTSGSGELSREQLAQGRAQQAPAGDLSSLSGILSGETLAVLLQLAQDEASSQRPGLSVFNDLDTDASGALSEGEFVNGRPEFASEEQAKAEFARLDADEDGVLTFEEVVQGNAGGVPGPQQAANGAGKPPPPPPAGASQEELITEIFDELDTNEDGVVDLQELMAGVSADIEEEAEPETRADTSAAVNQSLLAQAIEAYREAAIDVEDVNVDAAVNEAA